jgi:type IV secretory pathway TrbL component
MRKMIPFLKFSLPLLLGLVLLFYAFKNVQLDDFLAKLNLTRYGWVIGLYWPMSLGLIDGGFY